MESVRITMGTFLMAKQSSRRGTSANNSHREATATQMGNTKSNPRVAKPEVTSSRFTRSKLTATKPVARRGTSAYTSHREVTATLMGIGKSKPRVAKSIVATSRFTRRKLTARKPDAAVKPIPDKSPVAAAKPAAVEKIVSFDTKSSAGLLNDEGMGAKDDGLFIYSTFVFDLHRGKTQKEKSTYLLGFQKSCASPAFVDFAKMWGLVNPTFELDASASAGNAVYDRFVAACLKLPDISTLAIVFHGTSECNIPIILKDGLDPTKRMGQQYGPGEYFSADPGQSTAFCGGGRKMLVFVVVLPIIKPTKVCPPSIIVVPTSEHQLPLGVVSFDSFSGEAKLRSDVHRNRLLTMSAQVQIASKNWAVAMIKADIIQLLLKGDIAVAAEAYSKNKDCLHDVNTREIFIYAHGLFDACVIVSYFPDLPSVMSIKERNASDTDVLERILRKAKKRDASDIVELERNLRKAKEDLARERRTMI